MSGQTNGHRPSNGSTNGSTTGTSDDRWHDVHDVHDGRPAPASTTNEIRTMLAGGSPLLQAGVAAALARDSRLKLVAQTGDTHEAAARAPQLSCAVLVLNAEVPHVEARLVTDYLGEGAARISVLMLTENESRDEMLAALALGVNGYGIRRSLTPEDLCAGVLALARRGWWACPMTTRTLMAIAIERAPARVRELNDNGPLSEREAAVLRLIASGAREEQVALTLSLSKNTVKTYLRRISDKLQANSRSEALSLAVRRGIIPDRRVLPVQ